MVDLGGWVVVVIFFGGGVVWLLIYFGRNWMISELVTWWFGVGC